MDALFDILQAWNALMYLLAGFVTAGLGVALAGFVVYLASISRRIDGEIVAVRSEGKRQMYWPVVAYADEQGRRREANANSGSNSIFANMPGRKVTVLVNGALQDAVMLLRDWWLLLAVAGFMIACATPFLYAGFTDLHFNARTALVALAVAALIAYKSVTAVRALTGAADLKAARDAFLARRAARGEFTRLSEADIATAAAAQRKQSALAAPLIMLVGAAFLASGVYWHQSGSAFAAHALTAEGAVVRNDVATDSEGALLYHAIVRFTDETGNVVEHRDGLGSSFALYQPGDKVKILYAREDARRAMIDRGRWNTLWPILVILAGLAFLALGIRSLTVARG